MSTAPSATQSKRVVFILAALLLLFFGLGVHGHLRLHNDARDSIYKSLQLFHLHYHPYPDDAAGGHGEVPWTIQAARFGAGLWGLALLPVVLGFLFGDRIHRWWVRDFWSDHVVVWGHCTRTLSLVQDLAREGKKVVFVGHCPVPASELPQGVRYLEAGTVGRAQLTEAAVARAERFVALNENDRDNLELLVAAEAECEERDLGERDPLECYAHFGDTHLQSGLYRAFVTAPHTAQRTRRQLFNYYDHVARILARQYPLPELLPGTAPPPEHFVLVGFGAFGQCVAHKLVKMGQQLYREGGAWKVVRPRITVVDPRAETVLEPFRRSQPHFAETCELSIESHSCEDAEFLDLHFVNPAETTSIIFCLENETLILRALLLLLDECRTSQKGVDRIYLRIARPESLGSLLESLQSGTPGPDVIFFAPDQELFRADVLLGYSLDVLAEGVHEEYLKVEAEDRRRENMPSAAGKTWRELSEEDRDSNREAADHLWAKLAALGYVLHPVAPGKEVPEPDPRLLQELKDREEELARVEHFRWMTWRVLNGWRHGTSRDPAGRLHPDIVDYDELEETTKKKDRAVVHAIPKLLKKGRLRIEKRAG